jgi:hypothetical protein
MKQLFIAIGIIVTCTTALYCLDRFFFKHNKSFCIRFIHSTLPYNPDWELPPLSPKEKESLEKILNQRFYYLNKGGQAFAFLSDDEKYVIKFCRFPSSIRPLSWICQPFSKFKASKIQEAKRALKRLHNSFHSYKLAYEELKEETGLLYVHLNPSHEFKKSVTIVDKLGSHYEIPLDNVAFIVQKRAELLDPALKNYELNQDTAAMQLAITSLIDLFIASSAKGIVDYDAILHKNYGFLDKKAIHIDLGNFAKNEEIKEPKRTAAHVVEMTASFKKRLEKFYPEFLPFYDKILQEKLPLTEN